MSHSMIICIHLNSICSQQYSLITYTVEFVYVLFSTRHFQPNVIGAMYDEPCMMSNMRYQKRIYKQVEGNLSV